MPNMSTRTFQRSYIALESLSQSLRPRRSPVYYTYNPRRLQSSTPAPPAPKQTSPSPPKPPPTTSEAPKSAPTTPNIAKTGLSDKPLDLSPNGYDPSSEKIDWTRSFHGISDQPFAKEVVSILLEEVNPEDVEIKPDGIVYLPEIKYRRILNKAFGPGGWGLVPRSESIVTPKTVTREYALICHGRLVSIARGEQDYFNPDGIPTATEGCKSNALVRCCKDLGVASELWDPRWIRKFKAQYTKEVFVEHVVNKRKSKIWIRKDEEVGYPWKVTK
ncbi:mitochondrial genome maintenance protein Mgm101, putative [Talaromyces stipitatus ATCC 10500]|uniref:Mitochondrial genome maintenance protein MGM101 n=1 Tax=Talaromyces stipitatus (strain ATCC 10500 / CBS 375.48 / QM 6759 / NRRL 1006) TaxID=441959 RepID=B8MC98_TALSN|nr:mitochondrial genome maintenance protein Mgm101, putative [Talaromyces stipitatus ATCC 10500]EED18544.1 mitochondrial genome maintenance protein Mgm101, putative [Talaromyces stipitatus ATCC 10500]